MNRASLAFAVLTLPSLVAAVPGRHGPPPATPAVPSTVTFGAAVVVDSGRWRWSLTNAGSAPVVVAADRRLVWIDAPARPEDPSHPATPAARCIREDRPGTNELVPRVSLAPGEAYSELVDVRDLCHLHVPPAASPGNIVTLHYGFGPPGRARVRSSPTRSVVFSEDGRDVPDLEASVGVPLPAPDTGPTSVLDTASTTASAVPVGVVPPVLHATGSQAGTGEGLSVRVRMENPSVQPLWVVWRPGLFEFAVTNPAGRTIPCASLTRVTNPQRELWRRIGPHGNAEMTVQPAAWCPRQAFGQEGVYRARVAYSNAADGHEFGFPRVLRGRVVSDAFDLRVVQGNGRYAPMEPMVTGRDAGTQAP